MSDINLLPTDQRQREHEEEKRKTLEKTKVDIELTSPEKKEKPQTKKPNLAMASFFEQIKNKVNKIFSKKSKPEKDLTLSHGFDSEAQKDKPSAAPEIPKHFDSVNGNGKQPEKKFYYQPTEKKINVPINGQKREEKIEEKKDAEAIKSIHPIISLPPKSPEPAKTDLSDRPVDKFKLDINLIPGSFKLAADFKRQLITLVGVATTCILILLIAGLSINFILNSRQSRVEEIENENQKLIQKIDNLKQTNQIVTIFSDLLKQTKQLTTEHIFTSHIFEFLEANTLKEVYYTEMQFEAKDLTLILATKSKDYQTLAQQMLWFQSLTDEIEKIEVLKADLEKEEEGAEKPQTEQELVTFDLTLKFKPGFLNE